MRKIFVRLLMGATLPMALFAAWSVSPWYDSVVGGSVSSLLVIFFALATAGFGFRIAWNGNTPKKLRRAWGFIALGSLFGAMGEMIGIYSYLVQGIQQFPSAADCFYLSAYPLFMVGMLSLPYAPLKKGQRLLLNLDMTIVVLVFALFLWYLVLATLVGKRDGSLPNLVSMIYPITDLFLVAALVSLVQQKVQGVSRAILGFLILSCVTGIIADMLFAVQMTYTPGFPTHTMFMLWIVARWAGLVAVVIQSSRMEMEDGTLENFSPLLRISLVYIAVVISTVLAVVALGSLLQPELRLHGTLLGAFVISVLVLLRQYFLLRENLFLNRELKKLAATDVLTGLANRRLFDETLAREISFAQRHHRPLSMLLIDVDNFKRFNDRFGHLKGDALLQKCARFLKTNFRSSDLVARYGGDEFVVILPETDSETSKVVVEKLRRAAQAAFSIEEGVGLSIGCSLLLENMSAAEVLEAADQDMYRKKHH